MISKFSFHFFGISTQTTAHGSVASSSMMMSDDSIIQLLTRNLREFSLKQFNDRLMAKNSRWYLRCYWNNSRVWTTVLASRSWSQMTLGNFKSDEHKFLLIMTKNWQKVFLQQQLEAALIKQSLEVQSLKFFLPSWHLSPSPWFSRDTRSLEFCYQILSFQSQRVEIVPNTDRVIV